MVPSVVQSYVGTICQIEIGHKYRQSPAIISGIIGAVACNGTVSAIVTWKDLSREIRKAKPIKDAPPQAPVSPQPSTAPDATMANAVVVGQPLPGGEPSAPPPATQSNVQAPQQDYYRDYHVLWVETENIMSIEVASGVRTEITANEHIPNVEPERVFDQLPDQIVKLDGTMRTVNNKIREMYHNWAVEDVAHHIAETGLSIDALMVTKKPEPEPKEQPIPAPAPEEQPAPAPEEKPAEPQVEAAQPTPEPSEPETPAEGQ